MTEGRIKSRTMRRVAVKLPGNRSVIHYRKRKPSRAICGECGAKLNGVPRERPYKMMNMPKSKKRPERPFGGVLCTKCMRKKILGSI